MKSIIVLSSILFLFAGCENSSKKMNTGQSTEHKIIPNNLKESIGWIHGTCLAIRNGKLKPGATVQIVQLSNPQKIFNAKLMGIVDSNSQCLALLSNRAKINKQDGRYFYNLDFNKESQNIMSVGLIGPALKAKNVNHTVELDLNDDGIREHVSMCLTNEGVQFYISSYHVFDEKALWSDYYYLGYDNQPTCP